MVKTALEQKTNASDILSVFKLRVNYVITRYQHCIHKTYIHFEFNLEFVQFQTDKI